MPVDTQEVWIAIGEAARRLSLSVDTVRRMCDEGQLRSWRSPGGHRRVSAEDVARIGDRNSTDPAA